MSTPAEPPNPPIELQPNLFYEVTTGCPNPSCVRYNKVIDVKDVWSNADSNPRIICGICDTSEPVLTAVIEDPQPTF